MKKIASILVLLFIIGVLSVFLHSGGVCSEPYCGCDSSVIEWSCTCAGDKLIVRKCKYAM